MERRRTGFPIQRSIPVLSAHQVQEAVDAADHYNAYRPVVEQPIYNMLDRDTVEGELEAKLSEHAMGLVVWSPLAGGLLTGKFSTDATFEENDHRNYNREGEAFDRGETFAGVAFETGVEAANAIEALKPTDISMAQFALRWILMFDAVSCTIPGAKKPHQVRDNTAAADAKAIPPGKMQDIREIYNKMIHDQVHHRW